MNYAKKGMQLLILSIVWSFSASSQPITDTSSTRIPNVNLRAAVKLIEGLQLDSIMMARDITVLTTKVFQRDKTITSLNGKISNYQLLSSNYQKQISLMTDQGKISAGWISSLQKDLKRSRTKTVIVGIAGLIASGLTLYLTTK